MLYDYNVVLVVSTAQHRSLDGLMWSMRRASRLSLALVLLLLFFSFQSLVGRHLFFRPSAFALNLLFCCFEAGRRISMGTSPLPPWTPIIPGRGRLT